MFVTNTVLSGGTDCNAKHEPNIVDMFVTAAVLNAGTDCNAEQPLNICVIDAIVSVLKNETDSRKANRVISEDALIVKSLDAAPAVSEIAISSQFDACICTEAVLCLF